ncbi:hypothetical protein [Sodalis sp. dw_96]|uniref:hypothetical protein n=1 Tax=Sodalis sp. dw_96 TaxID=2719794 RepID=UPI001BD33C0D|nr:hypothetical protein [Sodalis sp. dw_96]
MKQLACILITSLTVATFANANAAHERTEIMRQNANTRIEKCAELLPDGHTYTIGIKVIMDKKLHDTKNKVTKELSITDETLQEANNIRKEEVKPFIQCMMDNVL